MTEKIEKAMKSLKEKKSFLNNTKKCQSFLQNKKERFCAMNFTLLGAKQIDEIPFKRKIINEASVSRTLEKSV